MSASFKVTKIEVGVQYTTSNTGGVTLSSNNRGGAATSLTYYDGYQYNPSTGPAWSRDYSDTESFDMPYIVGGIGNYGAGAWQGISSTLTSRSTYSTKSTYYNGSSFIAPSITINTDDAGITSSSAGSTLYIFPFIDITFTKTNSSAQGDFEGHTFVEVDWTWNDDQGYDHNYWKKVTNYPQDITGYCIGPDNSITYDSAIGNNQCVAVKYDNRLNYATINYNYGGIGEENISNLGGIVDGYHLMLYYGSDVPNDLPDYVHAFSCNNNNTHPSFQAIGRVNATQVSNSSGSDGYNMSSFIIRCYVDSYFYTASIPAATYTGQESSSSTFNIGLASYSSITSLTQQKTVTLTLKRNKLDSATDLSYTITVPSLYSNFNKIKTRNITNNQITDYALRSIKSVDYNSINLIYLNSEKTRRTSSDIGSSYYGNYLMAMFEDSMTPYSSTKYKIYEYFLYYKVTSNDITSGDILSKIFPNITVTPSNASEFSSANVKFYFMPSSIGLPDTVTHDTIPTSIRDNINNALWSYPISQYSMIGYSNYFLRLDKSVNKVNPTAWINLYNQGCGEYVPSSGTSATGSFATWLSTTYPSSYTTIYNNLNSDLINAVSQDDNILFTCIPMLIKISWVTLGDVEYTTWYLIKTLVDFRNLRTDVKNDFKLLSSSDFLKSGYLRAHCYTAGAGGAPPAPGTGGVESDVALLHLDSSLYGEDINSKIMSPIDIINKDLYYFGDESDYIKTISSSTNLTAPMNTNIVYLDMFNMTNSSYSDSTVAKHETLSSILDTGWDDNYLGPTEYDYIQDSGEVITSAPLLQSIFSENYLQEINSYNTLVNAVADDPIDVPLTEKGYATTSLAIINKDFDNIVNASDDYGHTDILLTPLTKYEDMFLTAVPSSALCYNIICINDNEKLQAPTIISVGS